MEIAKKLAMASPIVAEVAAGRSVKHFRFDPFWLPGKRGAAIMLTVGNPADPDEYLLVEMDLVAEKVFQVIRDLRRLPQ